MIVSQRGDVRIRESLLGVLLYYYYSRIFPNSRAQHCNYATLLALQGAAQRCTDIRSRDRKQLIELQLIGNY